MIAHYLGTYEVHLLCIYICGGKNGRNFDSKRERWREAPGVRGIHSRFEDSANFKGGVAQAGVDEDRQSEVQ